MSTGTRDAADDALVIAGKRYGSRLLIGTGKYRDFAETRAAVDASGAEIVTVAIRGLAGRAVGRLEADDDRVAHIVGRLADFVGRHHREDADKEVQRQAHAGEVRGLLCVIRPLHVRVSHCG